MVLLLLLLLLLLLQIHINISIKHLCLFSFFNFFVKKPKHNKLSRLKHFCLFKKNYFFLNINIYIFQNLKTNLKNFSKKKISVLFFFFFKIDRYTNKFKRTTRHGQFSFFFYDYLFSFVTFLGLSQYRIQKKNFSTRGRIDIWDFSLNQIKKK
jgi:hypothetical protein